MPLFQFHKGTIKTVCTFRLQKASSYFNSIKVQLKPDSVPVPEFDALFQFHKGTIKTISAFLNRVKVRYFNSIKVQLKQKRRWYKYRF